MYPNDPYNQPQPPQQNNYDFIMNPQKPKRSGLLPMGSNPQSKQLLIIIAGVAVFIILLFVVGAILTSHKSGAADQLTRIAEEQSEILHVAGLANQGNASSQLTKNFAQNTALSISTDQLAMTNFLASHGVKVSDKQLALLQDPAIDQKLQTATQSSNFDSVFNDTMKTMLKNYQTSLQQTYAQAANQTEKKLLAADYSNATLLLQQMDQTAY